MSRRFEPKDVEAIEKLRVALREDSSHSSNNREEQSTLDDPSLDPLHADLLLRDKVTDIRITGHELVAPSEDAREFAVKQMPFRATRSKWILWICAIASAGASVSFTSSTDKYAKTWVWNANSPARSTIRSSPLLALPLSRNAHQNCTVPPL